MRANTSSKIYDGVIINNNLEMLKYLHSNGYFWDSENVLTAVQKQHLDIVRHMMVYSDSRHKDCIDVALTNKQEEMVMLLINNIKHLTISTIKSLIKHDRLDLIKLLKERNEQLKFDRDYMLVAIKYRKLTIIEYLMDNVDLLSRNMKFSLHLGIKRSVENSDCELFKLFIPHIRSLKIPYELVNIYFDCLVKSNGSEPDISFFKFIIENGCKAIYRNVQFAARHGLLEHVKYLHNIGCSMNGAINESYMNGKLDCFKYLHENGYKLTVRDCFFDQTLYPNHTTNNPCYDYYVKHIKPSTKRSRTTEQFPCETSRTTEILTCETSETLYETIKRGIYGVFGW